MIYQFGIPIYNTNALMLVEPTKEEFDELLSDEFNRNRFTDAELQNLFEEMDSSYVGFTNRLVKGGYIVLIKEKDNPIYYTHELFHLTHDVLSDRGITLDNDGEAYAYLLAWIIEQYYNVVLKNEKESTTTE